MTDDELEAVNRAERLPEGTASQLARMVLYGPHRVPRGAVMILADAVLALTWKYNEEVAAHRRATEMASALTLEAERLRQTVRSLECVEEEIGDALDDAEGDLTQLALVQGTLDATRRERDRAEAERDAMRAVVEAAEASVDAWERTGIRHAREAMALSNAVDAYRSTRLPPEGR